MPPALLSSFATAAPGLAGLPGAAAHLVAQVTAQAPGTTTPSTDQDFISQVTSLDEACGLHPSLTCQKVYEWTGSQGWAGFAEWFVAKPLTILLIIIVAVVTNRIVRRLIKRSMRRMVSAGPRRAARLVSRAAPSVLMAPAEHSLRIEARVETLTTVFRSLATVGIWFVAIVAILTTLHIDLAPLLASAGIVGVALGFGAQNVVRDFLAGTFLVIEDQFGVGDIVDLGGEIKGTVEQVTLRATKVRDVNGTLWHVPNGQIQRVANKSQEWARAVLDIEVAEGTAYEPTAQTIQRIADAMAAEQGWMADIIDSPEVWGIEAFTATGYTIRLVIKTRPASQFGVMRELRIRLKAAFAEAGVVMPGGGRTDVWVHAADADADVDADAGDRAATPAPAPKGVPASVGTEGAAPADAAPTEHPRRGDPSEAG